MQNLFFRNLGEGNAKNLVILHGLFGSSDNWLTQGRKYAEHYNVYLIDQRNHGQSFHSDVFDYNSMSSDLGQFFKSNGLDKAHIIGHSMGGKTAMNFAVNFPECVDKLVVADIAPKSYPVHHATILKGLFSINLQTLNSRNEADESLSQFVSEIGVRQFLLKNLARAPEGFRWKINLESIAKNIEQIGLGLNDNFKYDQPTLFVRGSNSDYIQDSDANQIHSIFTNTAIRTIDGAGHWLHAEKPEEFLALTLNFLAE